MEGADSWLNCGPCIPRGGGVQRRSPDPSCWSSCPSHYAAPNLQSPSAASFSPAQPLCERSCRPSLHTHTPLSPVPRPTLPRWARCGPSALNSDPSLAEVYWRVFLPKGMVIPMPQGATVKRMWINGVISTWGVLDEKQVSHHHRYFSFYSLPSKLYFFFNCKSEHIMFQFGRQCLFSRGRSPETVVSQETQAFTTSLPAASFPATSPSQQRPPSQSPHTLRLPPL